MSAGADRGVPGRAGSGARLRVLVHTDQAYGWADHRLWTTQPFVRFVCALEEHGLAVTLCGRFVGGTPAGTVAVSPGVGFVGLPDTTTTGGSRAILRAGPRALRAWWRALGEHDVVWLLGPNVWSWPFAVLARLRGVPVVLGVRQDLPTYVRSRHPHRWRPRLAALALDGGFRWLARRRPAVVVGGVLAARYRRSPTTLDIRVSLVRENEIAREPRVPTVLPSEDRPLRGLSVGRLDVEKNPLLLADVAKASPRWVLEICGDGPLAGELDERLRTLAVADRVRLRGQVDGDELRDQYARADAFVHVSWTEGVPQVLLEAFAAGIPVVATAVGGVAEAAEGAALLVEPGDALAVSRALDRLQRDPRLVHRLVHRGFQIARAHTLEAETGGVAALLRRTANGGGTARDDRCPLRGPIADRVRP